MVIPLLATKYYIPPAGKTLIIRPQLVEKLDACLHPGCRLALISAPAGFGKTTLITSWADRLRSANQEPTAMIAWLSLDEGDNDPVTFWSYVISALQTQTAGLGKHALGMLQSQQPAGPSLFMPSLVNDLAQISSPLALILDDYHLVRSPEIHRWLSYLIDHAPAQFHVILVSRTDPPLPLALLRGRGQLLEIRLKDLRFSTQDAGSYLNAGMGLNLSEQAVKALNGKAEGWIAGLQMAAISLREAAGAPNHQRVEEFIASFSGSNRYILDYLIEEVLNRQPVEIQHFLLRTSILDRLCGPLCDALLNAEHGDHPVAAQEILGRLESSNLFILSLDDQRYWYRYHQLLADLLRKRLGQVEPGMIPELQKRAIQWYEQNGLIQKAVEHAFQAKDSAKAAALISKIVEEMWGHGEHATLLEWMNALPDEEKRRYPQLWVFQVSMLITEGKLGEAERTVKEIETYIQTSSGKDPDQATYMGRVYSLRTYIASFHGDIPNLLHFARLALASLTRDEDAGGRCGISMVLSNAYLNTGDLTAAAQSLADAIQAGKMARRPSMVLTAIANLVIVVYTQGDLQRAAQICQEGLLLVQQNGLEQSPMAANLFIGQGLILCERHELEEAEPLIRQGLDLAQERRYIWSIAWGYRAWIRLLLAKGSLGAAEEAVQQSDRLAASHEIPDHHTCGLASLKAKVLIRLGNIEQAELHLQSRGIRADGEFQFPHHAEYAALACLLIEKGDLQNAGKLLERLLVWAETAQQKLWVIRIQVLRSRNFQAQGRPAESMQALQQALDLARPERCIQTFIDEGEPIKRLLEQSARQGKGVEFTAELLRAFPSSPDRPPAESAPARAAAEPSGNAALIEPLTKRELEIIHLIIEGSSNKEIAQKLFISVRTVKYYTTNIFQKLGVTGRTQAAYRAQQLNL